MFKPEEESDDCLSETEETDTFLPEVELSRPRKKITKLDGDTVTLCENIEEVFQPRIKEISAGTWHSLFLAEDGKVYAAGWGEWGQLGASSCEAFPTAQCIDFFEDQCICKVACGSRHSVFLNERGGAFYTGYDWKENRSHFSPAWIRIENSQEISVVDVFSSFCGVVLAYKEDKQP
eukprot:TRINITY_DN2517_c0_g1_i10.p1 TRINITY_DN2517_c0_g1~~TRINITY_DN2517_c0_g1_i10.p1  ORF type:complete len:177 (+),score=38.66 TRINITY_DN2517_c0_g1_i10:703-1233(+)